MSKVHQLHVEIANRIFDSLPEDCELVRDQAAGGSQHIPLFYTEDKSRETAYCNVDLLVLKDDEIRAIIEIEESDVKPTQICGKFLTSALAQYYIHHSKGYKRIEMYNPVTFIQVVDTSGLKKDRTAKYKQWKNLENSISKLVPLKGSRIGKYRLLYEDEKLSEMGVLLKEACM